MQCPKCHGPTYDNRAENDLRVAKGEKMRPDFKCKDKACDGVVWRPKEGWGAAPAPAPTTAKQPFSAGPRIPAIDDGSEALPHEKRDMLFGLYTACFHHAYALAKETWGNDTSDTAVAAMAATLFIQSAEKAGAFR